jgi:hypothetical protein
MNGGSHSSPDWVTAADPGRLWTTYGRPSLHEQTCPQGKGSCVRDDLAAWSPRCRQWLLGGGGGEKKREGAVEVRRDTPSPPSPLRPPSGGPSPC